MAESPGTLEGWYALHDFRRIDWREWKRQTEDTRRAAIEEAAHFLRNCELISAPREGAGAAYQIIGHKADLLLLNLRATVEELAEVERDFNLLRLADFTTPAYSYLSVTELSLYELRARGGEGAIEELMHRPFVQRRLRPAIPDYPYISFYPMNKRRGEVVNWYTETMENRRNMMREHGATGVKYHDDLTQMITGSTGLDDWEWGITLFAKDPLALKKIVYEMRFDEVSAKYGEFGPFQTGLKLPSSRLGEYLKLERSSSDFEASLGGLSPDGQII